MLPDLLDETLKGSTSMRNFLSKARGALLALAMSVALVGMLVAPIAPAFAQAVPPGQRTFSPRLFQTQQTHYTRFTINFNSCVYVSLVCSVQVGALPYNAFILRSFWQTTTVWNAGTSASIGLGTVAPAVNILASVNVTAAGNMTVGAIVAAGGGVGVTGNGIAQSNAGGGFPLFATVTIVGALPTTGSTQLVLEWVAPNDGSCGPVPLGATAAAC